MYEEGIFENYQLLQTNVSRSLIYFFRNIFMYNEWMIGNLTKLQHN